MGKYDSLVKYAESLPEPEYSSENVAALESARAGGVVPWDQLQASVKNIKASQPGTPEYAEEQARQGVKNMPGVQQGAYAAGMNFADEATFGLAGKVVPRIAAAGMAIGSDKTYSEVLPQAQAAYRGMKEQTRESAPIMSAAGQIASYVAPGTAGGTVFRGATKAAGKMAAGKGLGKVAARGAIEGAIGSGISEGAKGIVGEAEEKASLSRGGMDALGGFVLGGGMGAVTGLAGKAAETVGKQIQSSALKPQKIKAHDGFNIDNVNKYDLGGTVKQTYEKSNSKLNELANAQKEILSNSDKTIAMDDVFFKAQQEIEKEIASGKHAGNVKEIRNALDDYFDDALEQSGSGDVSVLTANEIKKGWGKLANFNKQDKTAKEVISEEVAKKLDLILKDEIEKAVPEIAGVNKQISEIIPIKNVAKDAVKRESKNYLIGLGVTGAAGVGAVYGSQGDNLKGLALPALYAVSKNPRTGAALVKNAPLKRYAAESFSGQFAPNLSEIAKINFNNRDKNK